MRKEQTCSLVRAMTHLLLPILFSYLHTHLLNYLLAYLFTYLLIPWSRVLLEKLTGSQLVKKFPAFYGTRRFITAFTSARHLSLSWRQIDPVHAPASHFLNIYLNPILTSTPGFSKLSLTLKFPRRNPICTPPLPHNCYMTSQSHPSQFYHPNNTGCAAQINWVPH